MATNADRLVPRSTRQRSCCFMLNNNIRHFLLVLATGCLTMMLSNIITLNFTMLCMTEERYVTVNEYDHLYNTTTNAINNIDDRFETIQPSSNNNRTADFYYSNSERSLLFAAIAIGALIAIVPVTSAIQRYGAHKSFAIIGMLSACATALCPLAAYSGFYVFVFVRAVQGIGFAACMPMIGSVTANWASLHENGLFSGALTSFIQLAPVVTMPMSGMLCVSTYRWPAVFYTHAAITFVLFIVWLIYYRDHPNEHASIGDCELARILHGKSITTHRRSSSSPPYLAIIRTPAVWAVWIAAIGNMYSIQMVIVFAPIYIASVLHFPIVNAGFSAALPTLLQFVVKMTAGISSDRLQCSSETIKVRIFNSIAFIGMASFMVALACTPIRYANLALMMLIGCATILGFNTGGFFKSATLVGRHYSQIVNANVQLIMCFSMLTVPFIVFALTPNNTADEWRRVFFGHAALLFITNLFFAIYGSGLPADWAINADAGDKYYEHNVKMIEIGSGDDSKMKQQIVERRKK